MIRTNERRGLSLLELLAVITILGVLAALALARYSQTIESGKREACFVNKAEIELQASLWRRMTGGWPATNLSDIESDVDYFPEGLPSCPVDGTSYTIDTDGRVVGHIH
jgi:general secretion pathway protein G